MSTLCVHTPYIRLQTKWEFRFLKFWCGGHVERKNILIQAASSSVASAVTELFDIFPKLAACRHGESFLHNATHVGDAILARTKFISNAATATAASSQLQKDVDAAVGFQSATINSVLKTARQAVITARGALFWSSRSSSFCLNVCQDTRINDVKDQP